VNLTHQPFGPNKPIPTVAVVVLNNGMMSSSSSTWPWSLLGQLARFRWFLLNEPNDSTRKKKGIEPEKMGTSPNKMVIRGWWTTVKSPQQYVILKQIK
jgi:hypothetical protein